jgi:response regulator of citrate/malate metabolism
MNIIKCEKTILILGEPGSLRESIQAFVASMIQVKTILLGVDVPSTLEMLQKNEIHLLIIDMNNSKDKVLELLQEVKSANVSTQCLVLADDLRSKADVLDVGVADAILKGFASHKMAEIFNGLFKDDLNEET